MASPAPLAPASENRRADGTDLVDWDPTVPSPLDQEISEVENAQRDQQRRNLYDIREKLQRAMIVGDRFNCVEMAEAAGEAGRYVPATSAVHPVLGEPGEHSFASNVATSLLLSRQFEGISRKDIVIQESDERLVLIQSMHAVIQLQMQREFVTVRRKAREEVERAEQREADVRATLSTRLTELEGSCRRRTDSAAEETFAIIARDAARAFQLASAGHVSAQRNWVEQEEERMRWALVVECERGISRIFNRELSEGQEIRNRELIHRKVPMKPTALLDADGPDSTRLGDNGGSVSRRSVNRFDGGADGDDDEAFKPRGAAMDGGEEYPAGEAELIPSGPAPFGMAESETSSFLALQDNPNSFKPYWGWMFKSAGVLMTWQRRFFVFTTRGKLKCAASDKGPWSVVLTANNIMRVEVDSYHDTSSGIAPPTSQYHQYGLYVDAFDPQNPTRPKRLRFCCFSRKELNAWLTVLRRATDVIFALEESGSIARSPARRRLDLSDEKTRQAIRNLTASGSATAAEEAQVAAPPSYRRRTQLEEDIAAMELRQSKVDARKHDHQKRFATQIAQGHYNRPSETFGKPPGPTPYHDEVRYSPRHASASPKGAPQYDEW